MEGHNMYKKDFDRKNNYHKNKHHSGGCHFFYDNNSTHKENNTLDPFNSDDFDRLEEKEFRRRCKRLRYNERHYGIDG